LGAGLQPAGRAAGRGGAGDAVARGAGHGFILAGSHPQFPAPGQAAHAMNILLLLIPLSLLLIGVAVAVFVWAVRRGQFEDLDTPALDILRDDEHERP